MLTPPIEADHYLDQSPEADNIEAMIRVDHALVDLSESYNMLTGPHVDYTHVYTHIGFLSF